MSIKKPTTYAEQVKRIEDYGFIVKDPESVLQFLKSANYYRLSAYFLPFQHGYNKKVHNIPFERVMSIYQFDSKLRAWAYEQIENIEYYLCAQIAYHIGHKYGPLGYLEETMFSDKHDHHTFMCKIDNCIHENRKTLVVKHHLEKYDSKFPIWVMIEFFSTSMLSFFYADLRLIDQKYIAKNSFNTGFKQLQSWLRTFSELRNKCAHFTRLYYWKFTSTPKSSKDISYRMDSTLFSQILMLKLLHPDQVKWEKAYQKLEQIMTEHMDSIDLKHIGFPVAWSKILR